MILDIAILFGITGWAALSAYALGYDNGKRAFKMSLADEFQRGRAEGFYECSVQVRDYAEQERRERLAKLQTAPIRRVK